MPYDLMLLADPGPTRERVLAVLNATADLRPDPDVEHRYWLQTPHGEAQLNFGTKDPVESVHLEFPLDQPALAEAVTLRAWDLAGELEMRVEDMQFCHEIAPVDLPRLRPHWQAVARRVLPDPPATPRKPWWRAW